MLRFGVFEDFGPRVAAISGADDGDCRLSGPDPGGVLAHRGRVCAALGIDPIGLVCARQVHGHAVVCVAEGDRGHVVTARVEDDSAGADGLATGVPGLPLAILVADCVPLYLFDSSTRSGALIHAGREGTRQRIAGHGVRVLDRQFGARAQDLHALIGPSAGPCCYEVSTEMAKAWAAEGLPARGRRLDLWEANVATLVAAGVRRDHILVAGICTICGPGFYSHRRSGSASRNMAVMMI